jgi:hypothetical protein
MPCSPARSMTQRSASRSTARWARCSTVSFTSAAPASIRAASSRKAARSACRAVSSYSRARSSACPAWRPTVHSRSTSAGVRICASSGSSRLISSPGPLPVPRISTPSRRLSALTGTVTSADSPATAIAAATAGCLARSFSSSGTDRTPCASSSASRVPAASSNPSSSSGDRPSAWAIRSRGNASGSPDTGSSTSSSAAPRAWIAPRPCSTITSATSRTEIAAARSDTTICTTRERASEASAARCAVSSSRS